MTQINQNRNEVLVAFVNSLITKLEITGALVLQHSEFKLFDDVFCKQKNVFDYTNGVPGSGNWDLIIADLPLGMKAEMNDKKVSYILKTIANAISRLTSNGIMLTIGEPVMMRNDSKGIRSLLEDKGCSLAAIINTPEGLLRPYTELRVPLFIIKRSTQSDEFIGELIDLDQANQLANAFATNSSGTTLEQGILVESGTFEGFVKWKIGQQIQALETEYKDFNTQKLGDLLISINTVKTGVNFKNVSNCIYIHKVGTRTVTSKLEDLKSNHSNFFQCECDSELVDAKYLESFFCSKLGKLILSSLNSGSYIPNITTQNLIDARISIPPIETQREIANSISKIKKVREIICQFEDDLALNPIGSDQTLRQIDFMLDIVGGLADSDRVMSLIRGGESKQTEFKQTLTLDIKKQTKEKYIELSVVKTLAAFMNSVSGTLLVGVDDSGEIIGVDYEISKFYKSHDEFLLKFRNLVKERIGGQAYDFIHYRLVNIGEKHVLLVECKESPSPIYVDENDFYVRTNPATDKLDGPRMVTYITNHFSNK